MILSTTTQTLSVTTTTTSEIDISVSFLTLTATDLTPSSQESQITSATSTTICSAPAASSQKQIKCITLLNAGSTSNRVTVDKIDGGVTTTVYRTTLQAGQSAVYSIDGGWQRFDSNGTPITEPASKVGIQTGYSSYYIKSGATMEAAGVPYLFAKDAGMPGAFTASSAGINGEAWSNTKTGGLPVIVNSGTLYLSSFSVTANQTGMYGLLDILWMNSGLNVTTTTAQTITPATAAARDNNGTSNGLGVIAAIYVSTATTNAGAVTNTTISYTNQDGVPGKTGTIPSFPATATAGSVVFVNLAAGDSGVRSVESVTLGTSYGGGAIHLVLVRPIVIGPVTTSNIGYCSSISDYKSVKILPNSFLVPWVIPTGTTATTITGIANFVEV
jgi:hypothetical protein